jgi:NAD-dependent deacetylase
MELVSHETRLGSSPIASRNPGSGSPERAKAKAQSEGADERGDGFGSHVAQKRDGSGFGTSGHSRDCASNPLPGKLRSGRALGIIARVGDHDETIEAVVSILRGARSLLFITGAGISADSGLPTYRGIGGLYEEAATPEGIPIEEALSGEMLRRHPSITWKYIHQIEASARGATYNRAHSVVAQWERRFERVWVLTQNVDGLHRKAGSRNVVDIHGDVHDLLCTECDYRATVEDYSLLPPLPRCPECAAPLRPDVVLFGELLPADKLETIERELRRGFDVVFSIGTTSVFPYIARPVLEARLRRKATVEVNPGPTMVSGEVDVKLPMRAAEALGALWDRLERP